MVIFAHIILYACILATPTPDLNENEEPTPTASPTATSTPTPTATPTNTPTPPVCVELLTPEDGIEVPAVGKVTFSWTPLDGASRYLLNIILPSGNIVTFETDGTTRDRYMEAFTRNGGYQWNMTALAADGSQICSSDFFTFTKPAMPENAPQGDGGGDSNDDCNPNTPGGCTFLP